VAGVELTVDYPPAALSIPGSGNVPSVSGRAVNLGPPDDILALSDRDSNTDAVDDQLFVVFGGVVVIPPGPIVGVLFDAAPGAAVTPDDFVCTVTTAVEVSGSPLQGVTCAVDVAPAP
jgi:hypothetical protein